MPYFACGYADLGYNKSVLFAFLIQAATKWTSADKRIKAKKIRIGTYFALSNILMAHAKDF